MPCFPALPHWTRQPLASLLLLPGLLPTGPPGPHIPPPLLFCTAAKNDFLKYKTTEILLKALKWLPIILCQVVPKSLGVAYKALCML